MGKLDIAPSAGVKQALLADLEADLCDATSPALENGVRRLERNAVRSIDAVHIGTALVSLPER